MSFTSSSNAPSERFRVYDAHAITPDGIPPEGLRSHHIERVGAQRLADIARPGMRAVIAFTDATRRSPDQALVGFLLEELNAAGIDDEHITLLCATGLHRPMTDSERVEKLGPEIIGRIATVDHNATDSDELYQLDPIDDLPVVVNRRCVEADLVLATGVVEPHQYAGYSGGGKTVVIGCGGEATIQATHGVTMLDRKGTRLGGIGGNPFQEFVRAAAAQIGVSYVVNVIHTEDGRVIEAAAGDPVSVHDHLVERARGLYEVQVPFGAQMALAGVSAAKAVNLYQASRAATYLALSSGRPLLVGAPIILPAAIPEGAGEGLGERRFFEMLSSSASPGELVETLGRTGFPAGAQRAYVVAQTLVRNPVIVVGAEHPDVVEACHMLNAATIDEAETLAGRIARRRFAIPDDTPVNYLRVEHALMTLPGRRDKG